MAETPKRTRHQDYAEATRHPIIDAACKLSAEPGCFATKADDIAAEARGPPATVYTVTAGKRNLLNILITARITDPIGEQTLSSAQTV